VTFLHTVQLFADGETVLPRFRHIVDLTLDLMHHDGRVEDLWLHLEPDEFALLWRLARQPGRCMPAEAVGPFLGGQAHGPVVLAKLHIELSAHGLDDVLIHNCDASVCSGIAPT